MAVAISRVAGRILVRKVGRTDVVDVFDAARSPPEPTRAEDERAGSVHGTARR